MFSVFFHEVGNLTVAWMTSFILRFADQGWDESKVLLGISIVFVGFSYLKNVLKDSAGPDNTVGNYVATQFDCCGCLETINEFIDE